jgi:6-bladed beta-propeller
MNKMKPIIISVIVLIICQLLSAVQLELIDTVILKGSGEDDFIKIPSSFAVTEDGLYLIMDRKESDLKVFDVKGKMVKRVGRKGHGPNEFMNPDRCDYMGRQFLVQDMGSRKYMLYERDKKSIVKESAVFHSIHMGNDIALMGNNHALISGYKPGNNGDEWEGFIYNFKTKEYTTLLKSMTKYGFNNVKDYKLNRRDISIIGAGGFCDWRRDYAYFIWSGNLKINKINIKTKQIETFGKKTANYRIPKVTTALKNAYNAIDLKAYAKEIEKFSYIYGILTNKDYLMVSYDKFLSPGEKVQERMLQFYTLDGKFINEVILPSNGPCGLFASKDNDDDILYMFRRKIIETDDEDEENYLITRLKLVK